MTLGKRVLCKSQSVQQSRQSHWHCAWLVLTFTYMKVLLLQEAPEARHLVFMATVSQTGHQG